MFKALGGLVLVVLSLYLVPTIASYVQHRDVGDLRAVGTIIVATLAIIVGALLLISFFESRRGARTGNPRVTRQPNTF